MIEKIGNGNHESGKSDEKPKINGHKFFKKMESKKKKSWSLLNLPITLK